MTLDAIKKSDKLYLNPTDVASILHCDPQCIRAQARRDPSKLGYPVIVIGQRVRIPRKPFLAYLGYDDLIR